MLRQFGHFSDDRIKGLASDWSWYMQLAEAGVALPVLIFACPLADKIGRKPLLLWNVAISFVSFVCKMVIVYRNMNLYFYVIACGILGLSGSFYTFHLANLALLADATTKDKERSLTNFDTSLSIGTVGSQIGTWYLTSRIHVYLSVAAIFPLFLRFFDWILELFRQRGIFFILIS